MTCRPRRVDREEVPARHPKHEPFNLGFRFVLPRDAVAGVPKEYADAVIDTTLSLLATVVTTDDVLAVWER